VSLGFLCLEILCLKVLRFKVLLALSILLDEVALYSLTTVNRNLTGPRGILIVQVSPLVVINLYGLVYSSFSC
jgi:hypothetical protein